MLYAFRFLALGLTGAIVITVPCQADTPFAMVVVEFAPAPGQFVNDPAFNDPTKALGPPVGAGTYDPANTSIVSLGGFGGSITLKFDHIVEDDPLNPFGMDAIVFGNAFWADDEAHRHWAECATIEIGLDENNNGRVDDSEGWYLIPGSHITNPLHQFSFRAWDDDPSTEDVPPQSMSWVPPGHYGTWVTYAYTLPDAIFGSNVVNNPLADPDREGIYGYGEYTPTAVLGDMDADNVMDNAEILPEEFYVIPDDPLTVGITPGSGGGDAFDIAWALDPWTGRPAHLPGFDLIRLTNPTDVILPFFHEKSPEIDAVADVAPDPFGDCDNDGDIDLSDYQCLQHCYGQWGRLNDKCQRVDREPDSLIGPWDHANMVPRLTGPR